MSNVINKFSTNILLINTKFEYAFYNAYRLISCINNYFTRYQWNKTCVNFVWNVYDNYYCNMNSNLSLEYYLNKMYQSTVIMCNVIV